MCLPYSRPRAQWASGESEGGREGGREGGCEDACIPLPPPWCAFLASAHSPLPPSLFPSLLLSLLPRYVKRHPVPIIEADALAGQDYASGPPSLPSSTFGRLAGAICFDMDFPQWVRKGGRDGVSLLLQPSWTWGPLGQLHGYGSAVRGVENGFSVFRCSSGEGGREGGRKDKAHFTFALSCANVSPSPLPPLLRSRRAVRLLGLNLHASRPRLHQFQHWRRFLAGTPHLSLPPSLLPSLPLSLSNHLPKGRESQKKEKIGGCSISLSLPTLANALPPSLPPSLPQVTVPRPQSRPTLYPWVGFVFGWVCLAIACGYIIVILGPGEKAMRMAAGRFRRGVGRGRGGSMGGREGGKMEREALVRQRRR